METIRSSLVYSRALALVRAYRLGWWAIAAALATFAAAVIVDAQRDLRSAAAALGPTVDVAVATDLIEPGEPLGPHNVAMQERPAAHLPTTAITDLPTGRAHRRLARGEIVVASDVSTSATAAAAQLDLDERAIAFDPRAAGFAPIPGHHVDIWGVASLDELTLHQIGTGRVIDVTEGNVSVAIRTEFVGPTANAIANGSAMLVLRRGPEALPRSQQSG